MDNNARGFLILITTTGNYIKRRGSETPMIFGSEWAANNHIEIYKLNKSILQVVEDTRRLPTMGEFD